MVAGALLAGVCYMCSIFAFPLSLLASDPSTGEVSPLFFLPMSIPFALTGLWALTWVALVGYSLFGAISTLQGKDFRYIIIGRRLESYLAAG